MNEKLELLLGILALAVMGIGGIAVILIVQPWFWLAVIAITLMNIVV